MTFKCTRLHGTSPEVCLLIQRSKLLEYWTGKTDTACKEREARIGKRGRFRVGCRENSRGSKLRTSQSLPTMDWNIGAPSANQFMPLAPGPPEKSGMNVTTGEVAKVPTWVHEDGTPTRECLCWETYHGDLGGSSGGFCIVERNAVGIRRRRGLAS
jgi:hypothetical protein